jgi:hypothetical protein
MRKDQDAAPRDITGDPGRSGTPGRTPRGGVLGEVEPPRPKNGNPGVPTAPRIVGTGMSRAHRAIHVPGMREDTAMSVDRAAPDRRDPLRSRRRSSTGSRPSGTDARTDRARARRAGPTGAGGVVKPTDALVDVRRSLHERLIGRVDARQLDAMPRAERRLRVREEALSLLREQGHMLPQNALADVVNAVSDAVVGMGPIEFLLKDPEVTRSSRRCSARPASAASRASKRTDG